MTKKQEQACVRRIEAFLDGPSGENLSDFVIGPALEAAGYDPAAEPFDEERFEELERLVHLALIRRLLPDGYQLVGPSQK